jgi:Flp pilus assembly pilin Flp
MLFLQFLREDEGDMVERGLILAAIVVAAVTIWNTLGSKLATKLNTVGLSTGVVPCIHSHSLCGVVDSGPTWWKGR